MTQYLKTDWNFESEELIELIDELPFWSAPFGLKLLEGINYRKGITALDIGFGAGFPLTEIAMRLGKDSLVYGIDPWEAAVRRAEKKITFYGINNVKIIRGTAEKIHLNDGTIDLIASNNGLNNVNNLEKSISECARVIKPGGQFIQTVNLDTSMAEFYSAMENILRMLKLNACIEKMNDHIYQKRKPLDVYTRLIESQGFTINSVIHDKFEYNFVDGTTMLNHYFIRLAFIDSWKEILPADKQFEIFELIEKDLNFKAEVDRVLKLTVPFVVIDCKKD